MINKLVSAATLFTASAIFVAGSAPLGATTLPTSGADAALTLTGSCGAKDVKKEEASKAPAKAKDAKTKGKAKDGSCGAGTCGSKDVKKDKKEGSCGKEKK